MKKLFNLVLFTTLFNSLAVTALADNSTCFMLDSNGNQINLGSLCQSAPTNRSNYQTPQHNRQNNYNRDSLYRERNSKGVYIVPIKSRRGGIPVIDVKFNNRHVFEMMLDTGASDIVITKQMAKALRVQHYQNVWVSTPSNNRVAMSSGFVYSVGVAELSLSNPLVITSPTMDMGLLGQSFFSGYDMTIKSDTIEFRER